MPWTHLSFWILPAVIGFILGLLALVVSRGSLRRIYKQQLAESRRERLFLAAVGFFIAVLVVRGITIAIHNDIGRFHDVSMRGRHIHHLVWGILLLLLVGYGWLIEIGNWGFGSPTMDGAIDVHAVWSRGGVDARRVRVMAEPEGRVLGAPGA